MSLMPTAPQSIGGVLDRGIRLYKESFLGCLAFTAIATILMAAVMLAIFGSVLMNAEQNPAAVLALFRSPLTWLVYLIFAVVYMGIYNALLVKINSVAQGERALREPYWVLVSDWFPVHLLLVCFLAWP